ncbi:MAG: indole-3-glycerol phosphate synthase TrpC [Pyrinomonadaceae bacterium]
MDFLSKIIETKRDRLQLLREQTAISDLRVRALDSRLHTKLHRLLEALANDTGINIIAEIKRASPSRGLIRTDVDPAALGAAYERGGAVAISVLTEEDHFQGSLDDLRVVRQAVSLPLLRKDFIVDEFQIYEAAVAGADAILLIVAAMDDSLLRHLRSVAEDEMGMDALIEVHTEEELRRAADCGATLIGVNNRDLRTFEVSLGTSARLIQYAPRDAICISESGLDSADDLRRLGDLGYSGFLIGEMLMRAEQPEAMLRTLLEEAEK